VVLVFLFIIVLIGAVVGVWYTQYATRKRRRAALFAIAQSLGFEFSAVDPHDTCSLPFPLFRRGKNGDTENVMWGTHDGLPMRLFDYWYYDEQSDGHGGRTRTYHRFTCALLTIDAACPSLQLGHENFFSRLGSAVGFKDVELEYDDFNRAYRVKCDDQRFAFSLLDGRMMEWLLADLGFTVLEIAERWILVATGMLPTNEWLTLAQFAQDFHAHIPRVVFTTWPIGTAGAS
jgi:hypothetical protein